MREIQDLDPNKLDDRQLLANLGLKLLKKVREHCVTPQIYDLELILEILAKGDTESS